SEEHQVRTSTAVNDPAASHVGSLEDITSRTFSSPLETNSTISNSADADTHEGRYSAVATAGEAPSSSPQLTSTPASANAQAKPDEPPSYIAVRRAIKPQTPDPMAKSDGVFRSHDAPSLGRGAESAPIRSIQEVAPFIESGRVANLNVQLSDGQTVHATVRERAGSIDVKIVTSTSASAQRVSGEIDSMRQNLDAAGLRLGHSEVSYQEGNAGGRGGEEYQRASQTDRATD